MDRLRLLTTITKASSTYATRAADVPGRAVEVLAIAIWRTSLGGTMTGNVMDTRAYDAVDSCRIVLRAAHAIREGAFINI